ncbi:AI-2E family transporter [Rothia sp. P13129]|uniref:AI-2E family transporter n=1 Tax=Rothia sp. P13129 TaxID=3402664 RepID=UPI003AD39629
MTKESAVEKTFKHLKEKLNQCKNKCVGLPSPQPRPRFEPPEEPETLTEETSIDTIENTAEETDSSPNTFEAPAIAIANPVRVGFLLTVGVGAALLALYFLTNIGPLAGWIVGALFIALGLDPAVRKLESLGLPRAAAVPAVVITFALVVVGLISWVVPKIARQTIQFVNSFPNDFADFLNSPFFTSIDEKFGIRNWVTNEVSKTFQGLTSDSNVVSSFFNTLVNAGSTVANILTGTIIVLFLSLYFLSSLPLMKAWFVRLTPASKRETVSKLTDKITESVGNYVLGQAAVALLNGTFALTVMLIVGVPFPELFSLIVVILAFIPLIGGVSAGIIVSVFSLTAGWQVSLAFAICYFIYLQVEAYFISPRIMSKAVAVPGGIAIIAVAAGGSLWSVLGALIGIPVAASCLILVQEILVPRQDKN